MQFLYESDLITHEPPLVDLTGANLSHAFLAGASLSEADLTETDLRVASLGGANLGGANLSSANLTSANLSDANGVTNEQLRATYSLEGATMPDGQTLRGDKKSNRPTLEEWLREHE